LEIARFAASLPNVNELHLLPYHRLGQDKYKGLGRTYELPELLPPADEKMQRLLAKAKTTGLKCQIGG
jgi:pyruvate formate lyase activating enzyme